MRKLALIADFGLAAMMIITGAAIIVGALTGTLWL